MRVTPLNVRGACTVSCAALLVAGLLGNLGIRPVAAASFVAANQYSPETQAAKPPPPPSTGSSFARAYSVPYSYSVAESISQANSGGFVVGGRCSAAAVTTPNCDLNDSATVLRVDSSGNIQSQRQYSYGNRPQNTALNVLKATSDGGAIFAGQPQFGYPAQNLNAESSRSGAHQPD